MKRVNIFAIAIAIALLFSISLNVSAVAEIGLEQFEIIHKDDSQPFARRFDNSGVMTITQYNPEGIQRTFSLDGLSFKQLGKNNPSQLYRVGDYYVLYDGDFTYSQTPVPHEQYRSNGPLYVYNSELNLISTVNAPHKVIYLLKESKDYTLLYMSCEKEYKPYGQSVTAWYKSSDGIEWLECEKPDDSECAVKNSRKSFSGKYFIADVSNGAEIHYGYAENDKNYYYCVQGQEQVFKIEIETVLKDMYTPDYVYYYKLPFEEGTYSSWHHNGYIYFDTYDSYYRIPESYFNHTYITFGDKLLAFEETPKMDSGRILVPMRFLFEQMGGEVGWNPTLRIASFITKQNTVDFPIGSKTATVNGVQEEMDVAAKVINNKTYIPLRFLSESLGYNVEWDAETRTAHITTD